MMCHSRDPLWGAGSDRGDSGIPALQRVAALLTEFVHPAAGGAAEGAVTQVAQHGDAVLAVGDSGGTGIDFFQKVVHLVFGGVVPV